MTPDELRARLPIIAEADEGPTGHVLLSREELHGGTATYAIEVENLHQHFGGVDWTDRAALVAADHRKVRIDRINNKTHQAKPDGKFPPGTPALAPDDVVEEEVDLGYAEHLARWHDEGRFA